jgi:hypothetical protein
MAFKKDGGPIKFEIKEDGINELIDEGNGNSSIMLREVGWNGRDPKLELRKWIIDVDKETPMRGLSFITEQGPHTLTEVLAEKGFGNTENLIHSIKDREDFDESLVKVIGKKKIEKSKNTEVTISEDDYFDPKSVLDD